MPPVLFDETIDRNSGPTPLILSLNMSFELCRIWQLLLLHVSLTTVVHLEHSSWASYGRDNHRRARPLTRRTLEGCWGAWPAWWGVNKQNTLCFQFAANQSASTLGGGGGGEGHQIWIIYNMLCSTFKQLCYVLHWFSKQLYIMSYNRVYTI